jgi:hypothetical protein
MHNRRLEIAAISGLRRIFGLVASPYTSAMETYWLRATVGAGPIWNETNEVDAATLPLSPRLLIAIKDWQSFFSEASGDLGDVHTSEEFVSQGFKIAHGLRRELKGRRVFYQHPVTAEEIAITRKPG